MATVEGEDAFFVRALIGGALATFGVFLAIALVVLGGSTWWPSATRGLSTTAGTSQAGSAAGAMAFELVATEFSFRPNQLKVSGPGEIAITLQNKGVIEHDLAIEGVEGRLLAPAGQTATGVFTPGKAGTCTFVCTIPGHKDAGMKGTLVVGDAAEPAAQPVSPAGRSAAAPAAVAAVVAPAVVNARPLPQPVVAPPVGRTARAAVQVEIETKEVTAALADGVTYTFWTFGGTVPGPMTRVRQGDTVELTLKNGADS